MGQARPQRGSRDLEAVLPSGRAFPYSGCQHCALHLVIGAAAECHESCAGLDTVCYCVSDNSLNDQPGPGHSQCDSTLCEVGSGLGVRVHARGSAMIRYAVRQLLGTDRLAFLGPAEDCTHLES